MIYLKLYILLGKSAFFEIVLPMKECDTLKGTFQCQAKIEAKHFSEKTHTMVRGWYKVKDATFTTLSKICNQEYRIKGK